MVWIIQTWAFLLPLHAVKWGVELSWDFAQTFKAQNSVYTPTTSSRTVCLCVCVWACARLRVCSSSDPRSLVWPRLVGVRGWGSGQPLIRNPSDRNHVSTIDKIKGQKKAGETEGRLRNTDFVSMATQPQQNQGYSLQEETHFQTL